MNTELVRKAREKAREIFGQPQFARHTYHNFTHTEEVVTAVQQIGAKSELTDSEMEIALIAAWLHDVGYVNGRNEHETHSATLAREWLENWHAPAATISGVTEAILATQVPQQPVSMTSKVVCDADLHHFATNDFEEHAQLLRSEWETLDGKTYTDESWILSCIEFMQSHHYHTPYGSSILEPAKKKNIKRLRKKLNPESGSRKYEELEDELIKLRSRFEKQKQQKPDRGVETMFRVTSTNHLMLSSMADTKANIMISINSIILSVVVSVLIRKLEENQALIIPTILLVSVCLSTIVFAILATRPNVSSGKFARDDIRNKRTNLLFFGNFHSMNIEDYEWAMREMMKDADYLYGSMIKDIYYLGNVLGRKYQLLRIAYTIFMFGFVLSVLSFIIAFLISAPSAITNI